MHGAERPDALNKAARAEMAIHLPEIAETRTATHEAIDRLRGKFPDEAVTALHRELSRQTAEYKKTVKTAERAVRSAEKVNNKAQDVTGEAFETLISTVLTTPEGLSSVLQFFQRHRGFRQILADSQPALEAFLDTLATAARCPQAAA